jgi:sec-independent protein translocase protein TatB
MLGLSLPEIIFLAILALVVIGPKQLPEVARTIGRVLNELRRASSSLTEEIRQHTKIDPIRLDDPIPPVKEEVGEAVTHENIEEGGHFENPDDNLDDPKATKKS